MPSSATWQPFEVKQFSGWVRHPFWDADMAMRMANIELMVTVNDAPVDNVITIDTVNGYVKYYEPDHGTEKRGLTHYPRLKRRKGIVRCFYRPRGQSNVVES